jgi:diguanylate cyclase (GGDEF)-like protein
VVDLETFPNVKSFILPGGILLFATSVVLHSGLVNMTGSLVDSYYAASFGAGMVLAWRFHSTRVALALATLFLAERAVLFFSAGHSLISPSRIAFVLIAFLLPLNFLLLSFLEERGFVASALARRLLFIFVQSVMVAVLCRPESAWGRRWSGIELVHRNWLSWTKLPQLSLLAFFVALTVISIRFLSYRKPIEVGFFWSLLATAFAFHFGGVGRIATAYLGTAALILLTSVIETSYLMAYHDELTGVPARRAFNEALLGLASPYAIAVVDIDHFKNFNDTYGHETGDHVLRLVAAQLARVSGGGKAYRCGGEEFSIIFAACTAGQAVPHLESLRQLIERSPFRVRTQGERRTAPRGPDRRYQASRRKKKAATLMVASHEEVTVTVSIGVADAIYDEDVNQVIRAADEALYRAKRAGRNRIETGDGSIKAESREGAKKAASR